jgi:uncharacterized protein (TIGR00730 family)
VLGLTDTAKDWLKLRRMPHFINQSDVVETGCNVAVCRNLVQNSSLACFSSEKWRMMMARDRTDKTTTGLNGHAAEIDLPVRTTAKMPKSKPANSTAATAATAATKPGNKAAKSKANASIASAAGAGGIRNICVYCGSGPGLNPAYVAAAQALGKSLAAADIGLVYGGGSLGLMGEVAKSTLAHGGRVTGIIPAFLSKKEQMLKDASELIVTDNMHERKMLMFERSDAFVALPGGIGTLEELVEQLTWSQLGRHTKPIIVANIEGFWAPFLALLGHMKSEAFIRPGLELGFVVVDRAEQIVPAALSAAVGASGVTDPALLAKF